MGFEGSVEYGKYKFDSEGWDKDWNGLIFVLGIC